MFLSEHTVQISNIPAVVLLFPEMVSQKYNKLCQNFIFQRRESDAFFLYFLSHICVPTEQRKLIFNIRRSSSIRLNNSAILFSKIVHICIIKKNWQTKKVMGRRYIFHVFLFSVLCKCTSLRKKNISILE